MLIQTVYEIFARVADLFSRFVVYFDLVLYYNSEDFLTRFFLYVL